MATKSKYITREFLESKGACTEQLLLFDAHFPDGKARVTQKRAAKLSEVFEWEWLVYETLSGELYSRYRLEEVKLWLAFVDGNTDCQGYRKGIAKAWAKAYLAQPQEEE